MTLEILHSLRDKVGSILSLVNKSIMSSLQLCNVHEGADVVRHTAIDQLMGVPYMCKGVAPRGPAARKGLSCCVPAAPPEATVRRVTG